MDLMTTTETFQFIATLFLIFVCAVYSYRRGFNCGVDDTIKQLESTGAVKIVQPVDGTITYTFATSDQQGDDDDNAS